MIAIMMTVRDTVRVVTMSVAENWIDDHVFIDHGAKNAVMENQVVDHVQDLAVKVKAIRHRAADVHIQETDDKKK